MVNKLSISSINDIYKIINVNVIHYVYNIFTCKMQNDTFCIIIVVTKYTLHFVHNNKCLYL